jgi:hypothetical protein
MILDYTEHEYSYLHFRSQNQYYWEDSKARESLV